MEGKFDVLVDSDGFVGRFYPDDVHHQRAQRTFSRYAHQQAMVVTTSMVVAETATVLSHRSGSKQARIFLDVIERSRVPVIHIDEDLQQDALDIFKAQTTRGTSVTDCANVAVTRLFHIPEIFSFDKTYPKRFGLKLAA
jgi:predicted nucleic acid-binding protein